MGGRPGHVAGRSPLGRRRPRTGLLRQGRRRADHHRCPRRARLPGSRPLPRWRHGARRRRRPRRLSPAGRTDRPGPSRGGMGHAGSGLGRHGQSGAGPPRPARPRPEGPRPDQLRRLRRSLRRRYRPGHRRRPGGRSRAGVGVVRLRYRQRGRPPGAGPVARGPFPRRCRRGRRGGRQVAIRGRQRRGCRRHRRRPTAPCTSKSTSVSSGKSGRSPSPSSATTSTRQPSARLLVDFRADYARRYGEGALMAGAVVELVGLRAIGVGRTVKAGLARSSAATDAGTPRPARRRPIGAGPPRRGGRGRRRLSRAGPPPRHRLVGPALIDGVDTTVWVPAGAELRVDQHRSLILEVA